MADLLENIKNWPMKKKFALAALIGGVLAALILIFAWSKQTTYQVLFSNVGEGDSGLILQKLKELKVPYRVEGGGILVPAEKVYELRLQLAGQGLPQGGGIGFEIFDKTQFGTSDFVQKLNYRRALQGELARTIRSMSEIESCRVHLAVPEKNIFMDQESRPSASVMVKLKPGRTLTPPQVQGIVHLVSSSVEGLNPQEVTVIDQRGTLLTRANREGDGPLSDRQLELQRSYEKEIESRVVNILEPLTGKDRVRARAAVTLDFTRTEKTEERYDPEGQVVRSEQKSQERSIAGVSGGVPGTSSNLPGKKNAPMTGTGATTQKTNEVINYEISKVVSRVVNPSPEVKRLTVAVVVDGNHTAPQGGGARKYVPRTEEEMKHYEELVKQAVGFSAERGDVVRVVNMPFEVTPQEDSGDAGRDYWQLAAAVARYGAPLAAFLLIFFFILKPLARSLLTAPPARRPLPAPNAPLPQGVSETEKALEGPERKAIAMEEDIRTWAKNNPDQAAYLIKDWTEE